MRHIGTSRTEGLIFWLNGRFKIPEKFIGQPPISKAHEWEKGLWMRPQKLANFIPDKLEIGSHLYKGHFCVPWRTGDFVYYWNQLYGKKSRTNLRNSGSKYFNQNPLWKLWSTELCEINELGIFGPLDPKPCDRRPSNRLEIILVWIKIREI